MGWEALRRLRGGPGARDVLDRLGITAPAVDSFAIAEKLGVRLIPTTDPHPNWVVALDSNPPESTTESAATATIWYRPDSNRRAQQFAVAHALGHLLLHPPGVYRDLGDFQGGQAEQEVNQFAAGLLMPRHLLLAEILRGYNTIAQLAEIFEVSPKAMDLRVQNMGLVHYLRG